MFQNRITIALLLIFLISFDSIALYFIFQPDAKNTIWLSGVCSIAILASVRWATYNMGRRISLLLLYLLIFDSIIHVAIYIFVRALMA